MAAVQCASAPWMIRTDLYETLDDSVKALFAYCETDLDGDRVGVITPVAVLGADSLDLERSAAVSREGTDGVAVRSIEFKDDVDVPDVLCITGISRSHIFVTEAGKAMLSDVVKKANFALKPVGG